MKGLGFPLMWLAFVTVGCGDSGQTGSPSCAPQIACACQALADRTLAEATVIALDQDVVRLELEQLLTSKPPLGPSDLHRTFVGSLTWAGCTNSVTPQVGDRVFAALIPVEHCLEFNQCAARKCQTASTDSSLDTCLAGCEAECDPEEIPVSVWLKPWADSVELGEAEPVAIGDAIELTDLATCDQRYPPPKPKPCIDTPGDGSACSMSRSAPGTHGVTNHPWTMAVCALLAFGVRRLRLVRRARVRTVANEVDRHP